MLVRFLLLNLKFSTYCFVYRYLCFCSLSVDHCIVCLSLIRDFRLFIWHLPTIIVLFLKTMFFENVVFISQTNKNTQHTKNPKPITQRKTALYETKYKYSKTNKQAKMLTVQYDKLIIL